MTVTLNKRTEAIVSKHLERGGFATPDDVVNAMIEAQSDALGLGDDAIRAELLSTVGKPTYPYRKGMFSEMMRAELANRIEA